jgi:hypothetical protein
VGIFIRSAIFLRFDERLLSIANFFFHPLLCQNYLHLCVRIGKMKVTALPLNA